MFIIFLVVLFFNPPLLNSFVFSSVLSGARMRLCFFWFGLHWAAMRWEIGSFFFFGKRIHKKRIILYLRFHVQELILDKEHELGDWDLTSLSFCFLSFFFYHYGGRGIYGRIRLQKII
ncbi:hypothetical protein F4809DRAFT_56412 [Biscogniauxia mediterranea]|nr:hypothetical protein F4809DRAFT_56412 [Biscogniauxia mediterranea]